MIETVETAVILAAVLIGLGGLWSFALGGMAHMVWESLLEPLIKRLAGRKE